MQFCSTNFNNSNAFMCGIDARIKVVLLLLFSVLIFFCESVSSICALGVLVVAGMFASGVFALTYLKLCTPGFVLAAVTFLFALLNNESFDAGIEQGAVLGLRILFLLLASFVLTFTTTSTQLVAAFTWFLTPLSFLRIPVLNIAATACLTLRFIPLMFRKLELIRFGHYSRGAPLNSGGFITRARGYANLFVPLFVQMFLSAQKVSVAMDARCYGMRTAKRTQLKPLQCNKKSIIILATSSAFMAFVPYVFNS